MKYTLADADVLIERVKAARPTCPQCTHWLGGSMPPGYLEGYEEQADRPKHWIKRCAKCSISKSFPWAEKLDGFKVLGYMNAPENVERCFGFGELEKLVEAPHAEIDFLRGRIAHWKAEAAKFEVCYSKAVGQHTALLETFQRAEKSRDQWRERALQAERALADLRDAKQSRKARRREKEEAVQEQLRDLQSQIDRLSRGY